MLEKVLQGGVGGGGAKDSAGIRAPDPLDSDAAGALFVEGPVDQGHDVLNLITGQLRVLVVNELKASLVHRRQRLRWLLLRGLGSLLF